MEGVTNTCTHLDDVAVTEPGTKECAECVEMGSRWVHLRLCLNCGNVGCCDTSPNKHATAHARTTQHPLVRSIEPGDVWVYCYADDLFIEEVPGVQPV